MSRYAFGLQPDTVDLSHPQVTDLYGMTSGDPLPKEWSNDHLLYEKPEARVVLPEELLQYSTQTCVAQQAAEAVWCEQRRLGRDPSDCALISPPATYFAGLRRQHGKNAALADLGSSPRHVWAAMRELGVAFWEDCPLTEDNQPVVTEGPPKGAWMAASDPGFVADLRYDTVPLGQRPDMIRRNIVAGHCPGIGLTLSESFEDLYDQPWHGRGTEPIIGRHMVHVYAYDEVGVWIQNWWRGWGIKGRGQLAWSVIESPETTDFVVAVLDLDKW